jgi:subtilisin family serine protease
MHARKDTMCKPNLALIFGLLLLGCEDFEDFDSIDNSAPDLSDEQPIVGPVDEAGVLAPESHSVPVELVVGSCPGATRLIGVLEPGHSDCTLSGSVPAQWASSSLFEAGSPGVAALSENVPASLRRHCAYDYVGPAGQVSAWYGALTTAVDNSPYMNVETLSTDCRGEFEQGDLYDVSIGEELRAAFLANIGWATGQQIDDTSGSNRETIEVAIVDTVSQAAADSTTIEPANGHGLQMAALVREVGCPSGRSDCVDAVHHVLAMPRDDWSTTPDWVVGGNHGSQGDLAMGIYQAVEAWRERRLASPGNSAPRLVINLSLGWERLAEEPLESVRGPHASVLAAMRFASCHGALMIAAAGNTKNELCPEQYVGALAPARFEQLAAPTAAECLLLGHVPQWTTSYPIFAGINDYAPLVHAVGGLDESDEPLINARVEAMPRLAALGANGIVDPGAESLSGTSVSAAVTSATAALLWSYRPELRPDQVMTLIYGAGWATGEVSDFALRGSPDVHRVSVCAALDDACAGQPSQCPKPGCSATAPAPDGNLSSFGAAVDAVLADPQTNIESFELETAAQYPTCEPPTEVGSTDLASPQPEIPLCSRCSLGKAGGFLPNDDELSMTIDPAYAGQILALKLVLTDSAGTPSYHSFDSDVVDSLNRQPYPVDITRVLVEAASAQDAALQFALADGTVQTNRITITEPVQ